MNVRKLNLDKWSQYSLPILRMGLGFVFLWFGYSGLMHPDMWVGLVPNWISTIIPAEILVRIHGVVELIGGLLLFGGIQTRIVAGILFLVLFHTIVLLEYGPIMVRDIGLATGLLALALHSAPKTTPEK